MLFFHKPTPESDPEPITPPVAIGEVFRYLGTPMLCVAHQAIGLGRYGYAWVGAVVAEYKNQSGEIVEKVFYEDRYDVLAKEVERWATDEKAI